MSLSGVKTTGGVKKTGGTSKMKSPFITGKKAASLKKTDTIKEKNMLLSVFPELLRMVMYFVTFLSAEFSGAYAHPDDLLMVLSRISDILLKGQYLMPDGTVLNLAGVMLKTNGGVELLENLSCHWHNEVQSKAKGILHSYFNFVERGLATRPPPSINQADNFLLDSPEPMFEVAVKVEDFVLPKVEDTVVFNLPGAVPEYEDEVSLCSGFDTLTFNDGW